MLIIYKHKFIATIHVHELHIFKDKEGVAVHMLFFPTGVADKIEKSKVTEFDVNLSFNCMQRFT